MDFGEGDRMGKSTFETKVLEALPIAPFLAFGLIVVWSQIPGSGSVQLPRMCESAAGVSLESSIEALANGIALIVAGLVARKLGRPVLEPRLVFAAGVVAAVGCAVLLAVGSLGLPAALSLALAALAHCVCGAATAIIFLKAGELYGSLSGRAAITRLAWSHVMAGLIFFLVVGMGVWMVPGTGNTLVGAVAYVGLPLAAAACANMAPLEGGDAPCVESDKGVPAVFWKLIAVIFVLCSVMIAVSTATSSLYPHDVVAEGSHVSNFVRIALAFLLIWSALSLGAEDFALGRAYVAIMLFSIALVTMSPVMVEVSSAWGYLSNVVMLLFRMLHWVILSLIVCQKHLSPVLVFGLGCGTQTLGRAIGGFAGYALADGFGDPSFRFVVCIVLTLAIVSCAFLVFSEKSLDELFAPSSASEITLVDLFGPVTHPVVDLEAEAPVAKRRFAESIDKLSEQHGLSKREKEVFRYLAMGYNPNMIAEKLHISWNTVRGHSRNVYAKLGVHTRQDLMELVEDAKSAVG